MGDKGAEVKELQRRLTLKGFHAVQDGLFGPATLQSVAAFQTANDLPADGTVDLLTRAALDWPFEIVDEDTDPADALGVDVSVFGGIPDYEALAAQGFTFCIPRLGTGVSSVDKLAAEQIKRSRASGLEVPAGYFYLQSARDGAAQALHAKALEEQFGLPILIDVEPAKPKLGDVWPVPTDAPHLYRPVVLECLSRIGRAYGGDFLESLNLPEWCGDLPLWNAAYGPKAHHPKPWTRAVLWQYQGNVPVLPAGVAVDLNRAFGGLAALKEALLGGV
jgi:GH25 family lysozyme M1 (1,4-beta-N-acetylmuramidase)